MIVTRRRLLLAGSGLAGHAAGLLRPARAQGSMAGPTRTNAGDVHGAGNFNGVKRLALLNVHTDEKLEVEFFRDGNYVPDSLAAIQGLLRDYRTGEQHIIDPKLMDYLYDAAGRIGVDPMFSVISGYRSQRTNEQLRERSGGVAKHSLHMEGRAIDARLSGVGCAELAARARELGRGGVGFYRRSDFVHLDTGPFRTWNG